MAKDKALKSDEMEFATALGKELSAIRSRLGINMALPLRAGYIEVTMKDGRTFLLRVERVL